MSTDPEPSTVPPGPAGQGDAPAVAAPREDPAAPLDADDNRGRHLAALLRHPVTLSLGATAAIAAFVALTIAVSVGVGAIGAGTVALLVFLIAFVIASGKAEEDFFSAYARARGLNRSGTTSLPPSTPLLRKGDKRYAEQVMNGTLPGGFPGAMGLYTYEIETRDSEGDSDTDYYRFTVVMHDIPAVAEHVSDVFCQRRSGFRFMDSTEDAFRRMQRLELESDSHDRRFEVFYGAGDDENWVRQLFSPSFIVWLSESAPKDFAFELSAGSLCVNVKGHKDNGAELDAICEAAAVVARRVAEEAAE